MSLTVDSDTYLPVGVPYDPVLVMAAIVGATLLLESVEEIADGIIANNHIASETIIASEKIQTSSIEAEQIATNAITATKLNANSVTTDKLAADAITSVKISSGAITTDKLYASAVTADKISINSLDALSANLGYVTAGSVTGAVLQTAQSGTRVVINSAGLNGYDDSLGLTFRLPLDGSAPIFASGRILSATIIDTTIESNDFRTSSELPWIEIKDADSGGIAYRFNSGGAIYDTAVYDTGTYGEGTSAHLFKSDKPILYVAVERDYADIHLYNRSSNPTGAAEVGDIACVSSLPVFCVTADTPGTYKKFVLDDNSQNVIFGTISGSTITGTTITDGTASLTSGAWTGITTINTSDPSNWDSAYDHISNNGTDHSYIDQDVTSGSTPTFTATNITGFAADAIDAITEIAAALKSGSDGTLITGTKGTTNYTAKWDGNGDLINGYAVIDDDSMATATSSNLSSAESIKAYVDNSGDYELFTEDGTFTAPAGVTKVFITMIGGGAGGGNRLTSPTRAGAGGGSGAYVIKAEADVTPTSEYAVVAGTGGAQATNGEASSFEGDDYTITCNGGSTGSGLTGGAGGIGVNSTGGDGSNGTGGTAGGVLVNNGYDGGDASSGSGGDNQNGGGAGAGSPFGKGGAGATSGTAGNGVGFGTGGGGANYSNVAGTGTNGFVLVEWFT